jgi:hypothetical protein
MHANDEALIAELRALAQRLDPPPPELREARWAFTWRSVDAELAELMADSATDEEVFAYARAEPGPRLLTRAPKPGDPLLPRLSAHSTACDIALLTRPRARQKESRHPRHRLSARQLY